MTKEPSGKLIGRPIDRVDGILKVTGQAKYSADIALPRMSFGVLVQSTIPGGTIKDIKTVAAEKAPGVIAVLTHRNAPKVNKPKTNNPLLLLQDDTVRHGSQNIAVVIAETLQAATLASELIEIDYKESSFKTRLEDHGSSDLITAESHSDYARGNVADAFSKAAVKLDNKYTTPTEFHCPMEPFATVANWQNGKLTVYETTQGVFSSRKTLAETLGVPQENVHVISHFLGGGFGCKLVVWSHAVLAAMASQMVKRPVKLVVQRRQMFGPVGFRPKTIQQVTLSSGKDGKLSAIRHATISETSLFNNFVESCDEATRLLYDCPNVLTSNRVVKLNIGAPIWMRAPGDAPGSFALETAMDELADTLGIDPIELRLRNYAEKSPADGLPWSSKSLRECYRIGAQRSQWSDRKQKPKSVLEGKYLIGLGMASATHGTYRGSAQAIAELSVDGKLRIKVGTQDIGTGTYTIMTQIAADLLGMPISDVIAELGDTDLPTAPMSGGSMTAATVGSAVHDVCLALLATLKNNSSTNPKSPLFGIPVNDITYGAGRLSKKSEPSVQISFTELLKLSGKSVITAKVDSKPDPSADKYAKQSFGAQFARVRVDSELGTVHVTHLTGVYAAGKILNAKTARSQLMGGLIFGMSMAMFEEGIIDHQFGLVINNDLEQYHLPVHADIPEFDITFVPEDDPHINSIGAKGIGELGITGAPAAIANAVFNATGVRLRDLPIKLEKLL